MAQTMLRPRRRKVRRKRPVVQVAGMTADELAAKVGLERRAVRFYIAQRLLPAPRFRGASTRYEREHLVRLLMVKKLKEEKLSLREIRGRIAVMAAREGDLIVIDVIDNGVGLPKENRNRLLEPYVTTREKGTGLGLAIVGKILEEHGGGIELRERRVGSRGLHVVDRELKSRQVGSWC